MRLLSSILALTILLTPIIINASENSAIWAGPNLLSMVKQNPTLDSRLDVLTSSQTDENLIPVWVFFTDKGISSMRDFNEKLGSAEMNLTSAALNRRVKARGADNAVDFRDLPVNIAYTDEVLSTGAQLRHTLRWFNAVTVSATPSQIDAIAAFPFVRYIKAIAYSISDVDIELTPIRPDMTLVSLDYGPSQGQLEQINVVVAHELGFKGQGVIVCMMDTGYRQGHEVFQNIIDSGRLIAQYDFVHHDDDTDFDESQDSWGQPNHGTLTWSTLGGESEGNLYGPAYLASFILSKSEDISSEHHIEEDNWAAAAEWADSIGASVISASLGYRYGFDSPDEEYTYEDMDGNTTIVTIAADLAAYNGIAVATAQGNNGNLGVGSLLAPADGDSVIACGAVDPNGYLASFSALGPTYDGRIKPEVCAQGVSTVCADPGDFNGYTTAGGTSLSTPLLGGACAVLLSAHPNWTPMMVREALMMTADRSDDPDNDYGWGIADIGRALYYHPDGDIVFDHNPDIMVGAGDAVPVSVTISSDATIADAYLYYRIDDSGEFTQITMSTSDNVVFYAEIPGQVGGELQYYFEAADENGSYAFNPLGGSEHPYSFDLDGSYVEDSFEDGIQIWRSGGTNDKWGLTTEHARTGNLSITDSPNTYYDDNTDSWLESTFGLDLTAVSGAEITFYYRGVLQSDQDFLYLEASTDGGTIWDPFGESITGSEFSFVEYTASLADYTGNPDVRLRFHLVTDGSGQREGIYIEDVGISWTPTGTDDETEPTPNIFSLSQNYPNPFNPSTSISFSLAQKAYANIIVYDLLGRRVKTLTSSLLDAGEHKIIWDGTDDSGMEVASGIYLYKLEARGLSQVRRMTLLR